LRVNAHSTRLTLAALAGVLLLAGCGSSSESAPETSTTEPTPANGTTSDEWGSYAADTSLDERGAVEAYVEALDARDGATFCSVVAPWISGRFDIGGTDPDASLAHPLRCPELISGFIGYIEDCCPPKFLGAEVDDLGELDRRGDVVGVPITVTLTLEDTSDSAHRNYEEQLEDVVWVTQDAGAWRVAKLSNVAAAASIALQSEGDRTTPPDVAAERRAFAAEVAAAKSRRQARTEAYREVQDTATCAGASSYPDGAKDVVDYHYPRPDSPTPQLGAADIKSFDVRSSSGEICVVFEMAGPIRTGSTFEFAIESLDFDWGRSGFTQGFEVELRADGRARVSSGLDDAHRSISVPGVVGLDGSRLMLLVDAASFTAGRPFPGSVSGARPMERFMFRGDATLVLSQQRYLHDDLGPGPPEGVKRFVYPPR
jgi:hypothetical protein